MKHYIVFTSFRISEFFHIMFLPLLVIVCWDGQLLSFGHDAGNYYTSMKKIIYIFNHLDIVFHICRMDRYTTNLYSSDGFSEEASKVWDAIIKQAEKRQLKNIKQNGGYFYKITFACICAHY